MSDKQAASEEKVLKCVERAMEELFGTSGMRAVLWFLGNDYGVKREDIPRKPVAFASALRSIFGEGASSIGAVMRRSSEEEFGTGSLPEDLVAMFEVLSSKKSSEPKPRKAR